jgi:pyridoxamine 5'-phosphate oxidase
VPAEIEFWQHRDDRLHDRLRYTRMPGNRWRIDRLQP